MKYCVKCNKQLASDSCFCNLCGSEAVEQLPDAVNENSASSATPNVAPSSLASNSLNESRFASCKAGDYIQFGQYPQNNGDNPEPIDWLVLAREGKSLLVVSKYGLDSKPYNDEYTEVLWEQCTLRKWLNNEFMNTAFSEAEQAAIQVSHLCNTNNLEQDTRMVNDTDDKLFLLSTDEASKYLAHGSSRRVKHILYLWDLYHYSNNSDLKLAATTYAKKKGAGVNSDTGNCWYWLRSPGEFGGSAASVGNNGDVNVTGDGVHSAGGSVRPALRIILPSTDALTQSLHDTTLTAHVNSASSATPSVDPSSQASNSLNESRFASCKAGDYIKFGRYPQNNGDTPEPIDWLVLAREGKSLLVVSKYGLDSKPYNDENTEVTWEQCTLSKWLNSEFMNAAFSEAEQVAIQESHLRNANNPEYGTNGGNDTDDKLFLLSIDEAGQYLGHGSSQTCITNNENEGCLYKYSNNKDLKIVATSYANSHGAYKGSNGNCWFWLRSPGVGDCSVASVDSFGGVNIRGYGVNSSTGAVRPALRISLLS